MKKWAIGIAKKGMEIVGVDEEKGEIIEIAQEYKNIPRSDAVVFYNGPIISDHSSKNYREHGKIQQESEKETTP